MQLKAAAEHTKSPAEKHQGEAWDWLQAQLSTETVAEFARRYRTGPGGGEIAVAVELNKLYESFEGTAYPDPLSKGEPYTIGWGSTRWYDGDPVTKGQTITRELADQMLQGRVEADATRMATRVPGWDRLMVGQRAAMLSFAYNLGSDWYGSEGFTTISECFRSGRLADVPAALMLYRNPGTNVELGLGRRRRAEGLVWAGMAPAAAKSQATKEIEKLPIPDSFGGARGTTIKPKPQPAVVRPSSPFSARLTPHIQVGEFALFQESRRFNHQHQVDTAAELAAFMERCRKQFGGNPVIITSGYRPAAINRSVGGASGSEHLYNAPGVGAVDFYVKGMSVKVVQDWCDANWPYSLGYGAPKGFVHLGIRAGRPRVRWDY